MNRITGVTIALIGVLALAADSVGAQEVSAEMRSLSLNSTVATLDLTLGQLVPAGLSVAEQTEWTSVTAWITESRNKLADFAARAEGGKPNTGARDANRSRGAGLGDPSVLGGRTPAGRDSARAGRAGADTGRAAAAARAARGAATDSAARAARAAKSAAPPPSASAVAQMNTQYLALVADIKAKGSRFQTLSNASKARHDIAMKAINNLK